MESKYSIKEEDKNNKGSYSWRSTDGNDLKKDTNNRNVYPPSNDKMLLEGDLNNSGDVEQKTKNRSYEGNKEREVEKQRKFSLDNKNMLEESREDLQENLPQSRSERIHQLRAKHQKRHVERRGHYPFEEKEEKFEQVIRQVHIVLQN